jgi:ATP-dependent exoDNAse (exonuclease V) beta subunit
MLQFNKETHTYTIDGEVYTSVTELIQQFFPFDMEKIARFKATKEKRHFSSVLTELQKKNEEACERGRQVHTFAEDVFHEKHIPRGSDKNIWALSQIEQFYRDFSHLKPFQCEWQVYGKPIKLAGTIDLALEDNEGDLYLFDWKTSKELRIDSSYMGMPPFQNVDTSNYNIYSLQLNLYKLIIENFYGRKVKYLGIIHLNEASASYSLTQALQIEDIAYHMVCSLDSSAKSNSSQRKPNNVSKNLNILHST